MLSLSENSVDARSFFTLNDICRAFLSLAAAAAAVSLVILVVGMVIVGQVQVNSLTFSQPLELSPCNDPTPAVAARRFRDSGSWVLGFEFRFNAQAQVQVHSILLLLLLLRYSGRWLEVTACHTARVRCCRAVGNGHK